VATEAFPVLGVEDRLDDLRRTSARPTQNARRHHAMVLFLCSPAASWITGEHHLVAGGQAQRSFEYRRDDQKESSVGDDDFVDSYEDVSVFRLDDNRERNLLGPRPVHTNGRPGCRPCRRHHELRQPRRPVLDHVHPSPQRVAAVEARPRRHLHPSARTDIVSQSITYRAMRSCERRRQGRFTRRSPGPPESAEP
jgi:hypothetical protein